MTDPLRARLTALIAELGDCGCRCLPCIEVRLRAANALQQCADALEAALSETDTTIALLTEALTSIAAHTGERGTFEGEVFTWQDSPQDIARAALATLPPPDGTPTP